MSNHSHANNATDASGAIGSSSNNNNNNNNNNKQLEPPRTSFLSEILARLNPSKKANPSGNNNKNNHGHENSNTHHAADQPSSNGHNPTQAAQPMPKRACRAPFSRKFAHPCTCSPSHNYQKTHPVNPNSANNTTSGPLPPAAYTLPLHLWDHATKKCLPTSRSRDMLLKECRQNNVASPYPMPPQLYTGAPCVYDDLVCDQRRNRCVCKAPLHLFYESNLTSFGCVPIGAVGSQDGRTNCRSGHVYNMVSKECQKIFDVNDLPPTYTTGVSATQFSFVTIVLIWILLLILIVTAKLRKFRTSNLYGNSPATEREASRGSSANRYQGQMASAWLHPFIAAVNGHHNLNHHRNTTDRQTQVMDEAGNYNDTDFFLSNGRRVSDIFMDGNNAGSQQSLNNPPPKFEEIYPLANRDDTAAINAPPPPPANEDLPTYDEAMKLQNTIPPDINTKE